jgi:hypothetical protein
LEPGGDDSAVSLVGRLTTPLANDGTIESKKDILKQGCQIFLGTKYQNGKNIPSYHKLYQMSIKYNKTP